MAVTRMKDQTHRTHRRPLAGWGLFALVGVLLCFGALNIAVRATSHKLEDGVLWEARPEGVTAADVAARGGAMAAGIRPGDVLVAIDGAPIETVEDVQRALGRATRVRSAVLHRASPRRAADAQRRGRAGSRRQSDAVCHRRRDRHLHAARRRVRPAAASERSRDAAFLLAVPCVLRHADVFVQPARSARLVFLLGRCGRHAAAGAAVPALHAGVSRSPGCVDSRRGQAARRAAVRARRRAVCRERHRGRPAVARTPSSIRACSRCSIRSSRCICRCS